MVNTPTPLAKGEPIITDLAPPSGQIPREVVNDLCDLLDAVIRFGTYVAYKADRSYDVSEIVGCELPPLLDKLDAMKDRFESLLRQHEMAVDIW